MLHQIRLAFTAAQKEDFETLRARFAELDELAYSEDPEVDVAGCQDEQAQIGYEMMDLLDCGVYAAERMDEEGTE